MKKNLLVAATIATIGLGSLGAVGLASAATNTSPANGTSIVDKLVAKFGLNKSDVQAVFDQEHSEREAKHLQNISDKLAAGVKAGTITQDQSDKILAKVKELQTTRDNNRDKFESMTDDERKTAMETERAALKQWIKDNNIPDQFARFLRMGGRGGHGMGMGGDMAPPSDSSATN